MHHLHLLTLTVLGLVTSSCGETAPVSAHIHGPHDGLVTSFGGPQAIGHIELKLHADTGNLELWLGNDPKLTRPFDLPIDTTIVAEFLDVGGRKIRMRPRDKTSNVDESGKPNIRDGKTNYFIYPSEPEEDSSWLMGKDFHSRVIVRFVNHGIRIDSATMRLFPHAH